MDWLTDNPLDEELGMPKRLGIRIPLAPSSPISGLPPMPSRVAPPTITDPNSLPMPEFPTNQEYKDNLRRSSIASQGLGRTMAEQAANERARLEDTGSGVSQLRQNHPVAGTALSVLSGIGDVLAPRLAARIPGTETHHQALIAEQEAKEAQGLKEAGQEAQAANLTAEAETRANPKQTPLEQAYEYQVSQGMNPADAYKAVQEKPQGEETPEMQAYHSLIKQGLSPEEAYQQLKQRTANPDATDKYVDNYLAVHKLENTPENRMRGFDDYTQKTKVQPGVARMQVLANTREYAIIDPVTRQLRMATPTEINRMNASGNFAAPAAQGSQSMGKESVFADMHFNVNQTRQALNNLQHDFDPAQRAQLALVLKSRDPNSAMSTFLGSGFASSLTPDQVDYVTALASLQENAMALRGVAGMGQGSDELRAAIMKAIPGAGTPSKAYGNRQLDLFEGTVNRLETGVPGVGKPAKTVQEGEGQQEEPVHDPKGKLLGYTKDGKTFSRGPE